MRVLAEILLWVYAAIEQDRRERLWRMMIYADMTVKYRQWIGEGI